jgi:hypothetical protein
MDKVKAASGVKRLFAKLSVIIMRDLIHFENRNLG